MGRRFALFVAFVFVMVVPLSVDAGNPSINTQTFRPSAFPGELLGLKGGYLPAHLTFHGGATAVYGHGPFVFEDDSPSPVVHQLSLDLHASAAFFDWIGVGVSLPVFVFQRGDDGGAFASYDGAAVGDLRVSPVISLLPPSVRTVGLVLDLTFSLPTAQAGRFAGDAGVTFDPTLAFEARFAPVRLVLDVGYRLREDVRWQIPRLVDLTVEDELSFALGVGVELWPGGIELATAARVATAAADPFGADGVHDRAELHGGLSYTFGSGVELELAGGAGLTEGWGTPTARVYASVGWTGLMHDGDEDGDGVVGAADACPDEREDIDGFDDDDGCPDPDNDGDGLPDGEDACPNLDEDLDGFEDGDGCPEADNDRDSVPDVRDACPDDAEDFDGFQDEDGCPELDNDGDGFPDSVDRCPREAETANGYEDEDGCPDVFPVRLVEDRIELSAKLKFRDDGSRLDPDALPRLDMVAAFLRDHPEIPLVRIEAHTDDRGTPAEGLALTEAQAVAVRDYLVRRGVAADRLVAQGFGQRAPVDTNADEEGRAANRRVEFHIVR